MKGRLETVHIQNQYAQCNYIATSVVFLFLVSYNQVLILEQSYNQLFPVLNVLVIVCGFSYNVDKVLCNIT